MKKFFPVLVLVASFTGFLFVQVAFDLFHTNASQPSKEKQAKLKIQQSVKNFDGQTLKGESLKDIASKAPVVIINFWASWCAPCKKEMPTLVNLRKSFDENEVYILGVNTDDKKQLMEKVIKEYDINFPNMIDDGKTSLSFDVQALPTTVIIKNGEVDQIITSAFNFNQARFKNKLRTYITANKQSFVPKNK